MIPVPIKITIKDKRYLNITWDDGTESLLHLTALRKSCPCASCKDERARRASTYVPITTENQFLVKDIKPIGNYAIQITWADGHNTGIYSYERLRNFEAV